MSWSVFALLALVLLVRIGRHAIDTYALLALARPRDIEVSAIEVEDLADWFRTDEPCPTPCGAYPNCPCGGLYRSTGAAPRPAA